MNKEERALGAAQKDFESCRRRLEKARAAFFGKVVLPRARILVGSCYSYVNRDMGGNQWLLYSRIIRIVDDQFELFSIERRSDGRVYCAVELRSFDDYGRLRDSGYQDMNDSVFRRDVAPLVADLNMMAFPDK